MFLLDTNTCIAYLNGKNEAVKYHFLQQDPHQISLCSVVKAELLYGAHKSQRKAENLQKLEEFFLYFPSLPFDDHAAEHYGYLRTQLERSGQIIGPNDLLIASIALSADATLVTNNTREFKRVEGLSLADWSTKETLHS